MSPASLVTLGTDTEADGAWAEALSTSGKTEELL